MSKLELLRGDVYSDDHILETDIMRFLAIIGIVFWIVFALVKSIPFEVPKADVTNLSPKATKHVSIQKPSDDAQPVKPERSLVENLPPAEEQEKIKPVMSETPKETQEEQLPATPQVGIRIQFASRDDLMALLRTGKVQIFGRTQARGFDLFFAGSTADDTIIFRGEKSLPEKLWEIKSGGDYNYFLALLSKTYPAIRTFPTKQVLVSFADAELEKRFESTVTSLEREGTSGILSVTKDGEVIFQAFQNTKPDEDKGDKK